MRYERPSLCIVPFVLLSSMGCEPDHTPSVMVGPVDPHKARCDLANERIVFVSQEPLQGSNLYGTPIGSKLYADTQCQKWAETSSNYKDVYANKKWMAWLSVPATNGAPGYSAIDRINSRITDKNKPWSIRYGVDCSIVFSDAEKLSTSPQLPINYDQHARIVSSSNTIVWTGTDSNGRVAAGNPSPQCVDGKMNIPWSNPSAQGVYGTIDEPVKWSNEKTDLMQLATKPCTTSGRLYCFEVDTD